ncbi:MAG: class B sortase [Ruminococcus sp.]
MKRHPKKINILVICLCALLAVTVIFLSGCHTGGSIDPTDYSRVIQPTESQSSGTEATEALPENPVNFKELRSLNPDLYAWIKIPGTAVDYPVAQSSNEDDNYYLHHNYLGNYEFAGTIYSQRHNSKYFIDRVTVLYGHNMLNGSMFASLHDFSDKEFFEENQYIYIYIDGHIFTYQIFASYDYDDRHILNSFNFSDDEVYEQYLYDCLHPHSSNALVREGAELSLEDKILTLSTCTNYNSNLRFLVQGVLIDDQRTK